MNIASIEYAQLADLGISTNKADIHTFVDKTVRNTSDLAVTASHPHVKRGSPSFLGEIRL